jgi:thioredoxin reductase/NAD-dependent dihydropyrimidine dehydrogenase PreA subunit
MAREEPAAPPPDAPEPPPPDAPEPPAELYSAGLDDPRARAAQPRPRARGRAATRAEPTSDVTRFRGVVAASVAGAGAAFLAAILVPPPGGGLGAPGPLSRPHLQAKLTCEACHGAPFVAPPPATVCSGCHGQHGSLRKGHAAALASGALTCVGCHPIHRSDQGVAFAPDAAPVRFAPGAEASLSEVSLRSPRPATVAIPTAASCARCHALGSPADPIARCLLGGQEALGNARPVVCFDEHQPALPSDDARGRGRAGPAGGVCAGQHTQDRSVAWEGAREAAAIMPVVRGGGLSGVPWIWTLAGLGAAAVAFVGVRGRDRLVARRRAAAAPPVEANVKPPQRVRLPQIDTSTCLGCYACVDACPYDVLEIERYVAVVARPEACCGLTLCEQRCPNGSLRITDGEPIGDRPRLGDDLESLDVPGLYLAGDVTGLPLIKNAIHQGARVVERVAASFGGEARGGDALDLLVVGAGPAGISAALRAGELGLSFEVIEQGNVAQSIRSFPRGKLVFDQPLELPVTGKLWLRESTKEELLSHWLRIVRQNRLPIREETRVTGIARDAARGLFQVTLEPRDGGEAVVRTARRVLLAIGQRGSPRRLPFELAAEVESRVHYHLADAKSFEGKRVVVVGLGDVAMEAAIALSRQPSTAVTVVHRADGFTRGKGRNIAEVKRLAETGRIGLRLGSEIAGITAEQLTVRGKKGEAVLGYDAVLVMIGSIPPWEALRAAGVRTVADGGGG